MKILFIGALLGALTLIPMAGVWAEPACEGKMFDHRHSPDCPELPDNLVDTLEISVEMVFPQCVVTTNIPDIWESAKVDGLSAAIKVNRSSTSNALRELGGGFNYRGYNDRAWHETAAHAFNEDTISQVRGRNTRDIDGSYAGPFKSIYALLGLRSHLQGLEMESAEPNRMFVSYTYSSERFSRTFHKRYPLTANISENRFLAELEDCAYRVGEERWNRKERKEKVSELENKQVELASVQWELREEIKLQRDLIALTHSIIATQKKIDSALRDLHRTRLEGINARARLWEEYAASAARENEEFFSLVQEEHTRFEEISASIKADQAKSSQLLAEIEGVVADMEAELAAAEADLTEASEESQAIKEQLQSLAE